ncbi:PmoA family protein [Aeoliella sp. ICT_H6.2]|uniref:PmoA family protein n=1 Tax=Aeoliella straminimaris TaxID=2954799 RepID=A0A9X2FFF7_9BACT|nr:PmoA family protein [Aeoliella straminimaris]MCO6045304.1 PmoA family protein [Aeoliella straminimaris]
MRNRHLVLVHQSSSYLAAGVATVVLTACLSYSHAANTDSTAFSWRQTDSDVALLDGEQVVWQFNYGSKLAKPYFHPVSVDGRTLTWNSPPDHVWHHGVWFSWKYIDGVNYWELNPKTGKPDGKTSWSQPQIETRDDFSATIEMDLRYGPADGDQTLLVERRTIDISPPSDSGELSIDWTSHFTALADVTLDRTPARQGRGGGYAGLSVRFAKELTDRQAIGVEGTLEFGTDHRHRESGVAVDYNGTIDGQPIGLAFLDHASNPRYPTKWYVIRYPNGIGYINAALLHDNPLKLQENKELKLRYRLIAHPGQWDAKRLQAEHESFDEVED